MCWLFHKWGKWGEIKLEPWSRSAPTLRVRVEFKREVQERTCERCGQLQRRYLEEVYN